MIPLYGFLEGDVLGLLILADEHGPVGALVEALQSAAALRVAARQDVSVWFKGAQLDPRTPVELAGLRALDRFDVRLEAREEAP